MDPFLYDYSFIMNLFEIPSVKSVRDQRDVIYAFNGLIDCEDLTNIFITRDILYDLRFLRMFLERTYRTNYSYFATIPRLLREQHRLSANTVCVNCLTAFKRLIKKHMYFYYNLKTIFLNVNKCIYNFIIFINCKFLKLFYMNFNY